MRIAGISGDEFTVLCFAWVGRIVEPRRERLQSGFAFADVHGNNSSDGDKQDSFLNYLYLCSAVAFLWKMPYNI